MLPPVPSLRGKGFNAAAATRAQVLRGRAMGKIYQQNPAAFGVKPKPMQTPGAPGTGGAPGTTGPPAAPKAVGWDAATDPTMMGIQSQQTQQLNTLAAQNLKSKKDVLMGFGSQELARRVLGDDPFVGTVSGDPDKSTSFLGQTSYRYRQQAKDFNESQSAGNLFYGGGRGVGLRDQAHNQLIDVANQSAVVEQQLGGYDSSYAQAVKEAQTNYWSAALQQYGNWLNAANLR